MTDLIDDYFPDGGITDITHGRLSILLNFTEPDAAEATDHADLAQVSNGFKQLSVFELLPPNDTFNSQWNGQPGPDGKASVDENGKSERDRAIDTIRREVLNADKDASSIAIDLPTTGTLRAIAPPADALYMSYKLSDCSVQFLHFATLGEDVTVALTFNLESVITIDFRHWPTVTPRVLVTARDLNITVDRLIPEDWIVVALGTFGRDLSGELGSITATGQQNAGLARGIDAFATLLVNRGVPAGFTACVPEIDVDNTALVVRLIHANDPAPMLVAVTVGDGGLIPATLAADRTVVHAGDQLTLIGQNFPPNRANRTGVSWNDTTTGVLLRSELDVSVNSAPAQRTTVQRQPLDTKNVFFAEDLQPNSRVSFSVRDCDLVACTPFSNIVDTTTDAGSGVALDLEAAGVSVVLANTASVDSAGAFSASVVVPANTTPGVHRLIATVGNTSGSTAITVLPTPQPIPLQLHQIDPSSGQIIGTLIFPKQLVGVRGDGFGPNADIIVQLDGTVFSASVATPRAEPSGSFSASFIWPADSTAGNHTIIATEDHVFPVVSASTVVFVELPPH